MWQKRTQKILKFVVLMIGVIVGLQHLKMGGRAWFVARNDEPAALWLFIWTGPLCTFPASITAFFNQRIGGWWLVAGAFMSYVGWMGALGPKGDFENAMWFLVRWSGPMLVLGLAFLFLAKHGKGRATSP